MRDTYKKYIEEAEGKDPDFPLITFGGNKGKTLTKGRNVYSLFEEGNIPEDFHGIETSRKNTPEIRREEPQGLTPREARQRNTQDRKSKK